jgi:hypothetical protein
LYFVHRHLKFFDLVLKSVVAFLQNLIEALLHAGEYVEAVELLSSVLVELNSAAVDEFLGNYSISMHINSLKLLTRHFAVEDVLPKSKNHGVVGTLGHCPILFIVLIETVLVPGDQLSVWESVT